ncbi:MAG: alpha/beta hydrolase-fold protein [Gemmatimonadales bacterium]
MWERRHHAWESPALLGRTMDLLVLGHAGVRLLAFPTSQGSWHDWEDRQMPDAVGDLLAGGALQMFCVASADDRSWYDETIPVHQRAEWQARYDAFLHDEVVPFTRSRNDHPLLMTAGASFGGYHAICFAMRYPHLVSRALSMSGLPDVRRLTGGISDDLAYFYNPAEFAVHEHDPERMAQLQRLDLILAVGRDDSLCAANETFSHALWQRGIGNALRIWDGWAHDWPYWQRMLRLYVNGHD